jgi:DNA replication and repair protein RecF
VSIASLQVENVRSITQVALELHPHRNLIWGPNGSGKTSLLESLYLLGRGRSFRTRNTERLIQEGKDALVVVGRTGDPVAHTIGFQCTKDTGSTARIDGSTVTTFAELSSACPTQVIDPSVHRLLEEGALRRRQWLDWTVFHVEPSFVETWIRYARALKQRNAALRTASATAGAWDAEIAILGDALTAARENVIAQMQIIWKPLVERMAKLPIDLGFARGWARDHTFAEALRSAGVRDRQRGTTSVGAHRADVQLRVRGRAATEVLSRGQQKLAAVALILAQLEFVQAATGHSTQLLLDDAVAELDEQSLARFITELSRLDTQQIWSGLTPNTSLFQGSASVFHVERGAIKTYNAPC